MKLEFNWDTKPIYNVIAKMKGTELPDQWIIRGNHHDAWVNGADDPTSGQVAMLEEARGIAELAKTGWKPKGTIVFCSQVGELRPGGFVVFAQVRQAEHPGDETDRFAGGGKAVWAGGDS